VIYNTLFPECPLLFEGKLIPGLDKDEGLQESILELHAKGFSLPTYEELHSVYLWTELQMNSLGMSFQGRRSDYFFYDWHYLETGTKLYELDDDSDATSLRSDVDLVSPTSSVSSDSTDFDTLLARKRAKLAQMDSLEDDSDNMHLKG
jgi:hypothetical protein